MPGPLEIPYPGRLKEVACASLYLAVIFVSYSPTVQEISFVLHTRLGIVGGGSSKPVINIGLHHLSSTSLLLMSRSLWNRHWREELDVLSGSCGSRTESNVPPARSSVIKTRALSVGSCVTARVQDLAPRRLPMVHGGDRL